MKLGSLIVEIGADTANFVKGVADTKIQLRSLDDQVVAGAKNLALFGAAAAAAAATGLAAMTYAGMKSIEATGDLANQLNTTSASIVTLSRAGDLAGVSFEKISMAGKMLTLNLGKAVDSASPAAVALARLHLSADAIAKLPLDQRISTINDAIQKFVVPTEQAAVAADLFGAKAAIAVTKLDGDSIRAAAEQTRILGLQLSELDSTRVNMAADAFGLFEMAAKGVENQLAIALAPLIRQVSTDFLQATDKAGGMGEVTKNAIHGVIEAMAFMANAADGVGRTFEIVAKTIVLAFEGVITTIGGAMTTLVTSANDALEAVGIHTLSDKATEMQEKFAYHMGVIKEASLDLKTVLERPLAGDMFKDYVAKAEAASTALAKANLPQHNQIGDEQGHGVDKGAQTAKDAEQKEFDARLKQLLEQHETVQQLEKEHNQAMADINRARDEGKITDTAQYNALQQSLADEHATKLAAIENAAAEQRDAMEAMRRKNMIDASGQFFGNMSTLMNSGSRKLFEIGKVAAIANAVVAGTEAAVHSFNFGAKLGGPVLGGAMAAASLLATGVQIQSIRAQQFGGGSGNGSASGAASATAAVNAASTPVQPAGAAGAPSSFTVAGLDPGALFTGAQVRSLMTRMNEESRTGSKLTFAA